MNVLLLSMPDSFEHMPPIAVRMPNGALASLAGNLDAHHRVSIADLILVQSSVRSTLERMVRDLEPDVVGLSVMTFQRATAFALARSCGSCARRPASSSAATIRAWRRRPTKASPAIDFIVRGEGEHTLRELLRVLESEGLDAAVGARSCAVPGLPTARATASCAIPIGRS